MQHLLCLFSICFIFLISLIEPSLVHLSANTIYELLVRSSIDQLVYIHRALALRYEIVQFLFLHKRRVDSVYSWTQVALGSHDIILRKLYCQGLFLILLANYTCWVVESFPMLRQLAQLLFALFALHWLLFVAQGSTQPVSVELTWNLVFQGIFSLEILLLVFCHYLFQSVLEIEVFDFIPVLAFEVEMYLTNRRAFIGISYFLVFNFYSGVAVFILTTATLVVFAFALLYFCVFLALCLYFFLFTNHSSCWWHFIFFISQFMGTATIAILAFDQSQVGRVIHELVAAFFSF